MLENYKINYRKYKFFFKYCVIGALSISLELFLRYMFLLFGLGEIVTLVLPLSFGIIFAFICNVNFNFNIPRYYYKYSFIYFTLISLTSFSIQFTLSKAFFFQDLKYEITRFIMSGLVFIIAYNFHIKFSFRRNKKVGVAIYLDKKEIINDIFSKVGFYPDYIHIDLVDKTMNSNDSDPDFSKLDEVRKKWPNHRIESHIMSKEPSKYIDKLSSYSDVIYFHLEINEDINIIKEIIIKKGIKAGIVLHASKKYNNIKEIIKDFKEVLILCIDKPGQSGQEFLDQSFSIINSANNLKNRSNFLLCVDGGLSQKNIIKIDCDKIVSASNVFKSLNPKKQIINLQKLLNN